MTPATLSDLPGIGPQLEERLLKAFRDEAGFLAALEQADLDRLTAVDGVSPARAVAWCRVARGEVDQDAVFGTPAARKVFERVQERLQSYASTAPGRHRLMLIGPCMDQAQAEARAQTIDRDRKDLRALDRPAVQKALRQIRPLRTERPVMDPSTLIACESDAVYERLHGLGVGRWVRLGTRRDLGETSPDELVIFAYDEGALDTSGLDGIVDVAGDAPLATICPEAVLSPLRHGMKTLQALAELADLHGTPTVAPEALEALASAGSASQQNPDLAGAADAIRPELDAMLEERLAQVRLTGPEAMRAIAAGRAPPEMEKVQQAVLAEGRARLLAETGMDVEAFLPGLPLTLDDDAIRAALAKHEGTARATRFTRQQRAAKTIAALRPKLDTEVDTWFKHDARYALACFAEDHHLRPARFDTGFRFERSVHLDLATMPESQWIAYRLGDPERAALLTGANSGGKSTLLEHLTQLALMARAGLPVVGGATVPWIEEVHLVTARKGLDAGALETFLRGFVPLAEGQTRRLVLADEVEAITELESAARILSFVLRRLAATDSLAVVATHLAPQILDHVPDVRVDGIEAKGLDEGHRLIVDRTPRMGMLARSTPELVVQRLAATTKGQRAALFQDLADALAEASRETPILTG